MMCFKLSFITFFIFYFIAPLKFFFPPLFFGLFPLVSAGSVLVHVT